MFPSLQGGNPLLGQEPPGQRRHGGSLGGLGVVVAEAVQQTVHGEKAELLVRRPGRLGDGALDADRDVAGVHLVDKYGVSPVDVIVVHDDMDLPLGRLRLRRNGSPGGQKGVRSLADSWRFKDFIRVRVGIGRPPEDMDPTDYVLRRFNPDERAVLERVLPRAADAVVAIVRDGLDRAASSFNAVIKDEQPEAADA